MVITKKKNRAVTVTPVGHAYINASFNNLIITITNTNGDAVAYCSAGIIGERLRIHNAKKITTPYITQLTSQECAQMAIDYGVKSLKVFIKGVGVGREIALRTFIESGLQLLSITDRTSLPHGGCRPKKVRRN